MPKDADDVELAKNDRAIAAASTPQLHRPTTKRGVYVQIELVVIKSPRSDYAMMGNGKLVSHRLSFDMGTRIQSFDLTSQVSQCVDLSDCHSRLTWAY